MGKLEGIIILSADGRPIVHSHFANSIPSYPLLHSDYLNTLLSSIAATNAQLTNASTASTSHTPSSRITSTKDIKPVLWVPGIPIPPLSAHDDDGDQGQQDGQDDDDIDQEEQDEHGRASTSYSASTPRRKPMNLHGADLEADNVWSDAVRHEPPIPRPQEPPLSATTQQRAAAVISQAQEAMAEQGAALCHLRSGNLRFLCPVSREVDPLVPLAFLRAFIAILQEYLAQSSDPAALSEDAIRDNFDIVYQLFEEILDKDGNVLTTEVNTLKSLVLPPSWVDKIVKAVGVGGLASATPPPMVSSIPWRRTNTKYTNNEFYVDLVESLEGILDRHGRPVALDLWGRLECNSRLSGTPELTLSFNDATRVQDYALHPCVRHRQWNKEKQLSFIPPDGTFELASFRIGAPHAVPLPGAGRTTPTIASPCNGWAKSVPLSILAEFSSEAPSKASGGSASTGTFSVQLTSLLPPKLALEDVEVSFGLGAGTQSVDASVGGGSATLSSSSSVGATVTSLGSHHIATASLGGPTNSSSQTNAGTFLFDQNEKVLVWRIPKVSADRRPPMLKGSWSSCDVPPRPTALSVTFSIPVHSLSGLKVTALNVHNESYRPFKGVRSMVRGRLQWRI
ncbi:hypothetical protein ACQY0O_003350 [Thecaphora frezii]